MQNKFLRYVLCVSCALLTVRAVQAQEMGDFVIPEADISAPVTTSSSGEIVPDLNGKQAVDFPARTSLESLELAPLPGIYETNVTGPQPMGTSVSVKDLPSERLIGMLTPEVFKEMAELERDNTFMKLQIQKEEGKNRLETVRAMYRQARLDEIAKREELVRTRIQWWQEQEKIRQDLEAQRAALEAARAEQEIQEPEIPEENEEEDDQPKVPEKEYTLVDIFGTRGNLSARVKNINTGRLSTIQVGDLLADGSKVEEITASQVSLLKDDFKLLLEFEDLAADADDMDDDGE